MKLITAIIRPEKLGELIEVVIPYLESNASDSQLLALWKTGYSPGITEFQRAQYSSMLENTA